MGEKSDDSERIPLLQRAFGLLEWLPRGGAGFGEIRERFEGLPPSTVSRLLKALIAEGILRRSESGGYELDSRMEILAQRIVGRAPRQELVRPVLQRLAREVGESAAYFEPVEGGIILLAKHEIPEAYHYMSEGGVNTNLKTHGFNVLMHGAKKREVFTNFKDDKPLLVRVGALVKAGGETVGVLGISFFAGGMDKERQGYLENMVLQAAEEAGRQIS